MPRNASGNYTLPAGNPVLTGTTIASTWANPTLSDVGNEVEDSLSRTGKGGMLAPLKHVAGTKAAPAVTFGTEPQSGWYLAGVNDLRLSVGGVDAIRVVSGQLQIWVAADSAFYPIVTSKTAGAVVETQTLTALQTVVPFTNNVAGAALYLDGTSGDRGRLLLGTDYTYDAVANEVTLTTDYPDGTQLFAVINDETDVAAAAAAASASASAAAASESNASDSEAAAAASASAASDSKDAASTAESNASASASAASDSETRAQEWAENPEDDPVIAGEFSALHWAKKAQDAVAQGVIDDSVTSENLTWSSDKISTELDGKVDDTIAQMDRYDTVSGDATATLDFNVQQVFRVDASTPRTLSFSNVPGTDRAIVAIVHISGNSAITWPGSIDWDEGAAPELGDSFTRVMLIWDGNGWTGNARARA